MGSWDYGIFDDDTALDFVNEIKANPSSARELFQEAFDKAINVDYLEYDDCHMVTVSAAYLDNFLNQTKYEMDYADDSDESNVNLFYQLQDNLELEDLRESAVLALKKVISDQSELKEIWAENEDLYPHWLAELEELCERLE